MKLDDSVVGHIAHLLQMAILTGTDIVDHLRLVDLSLDEETNKLHLDKNYLTNHDANIGKMLKQAEAASLEIIQSEELDN